MLGYILGKCRATQSSRHGQNNACFPHVWWKNCHLREKTATELHEFRWCHPKSACPGWSHLSWGPPRDTTGLECRAMDKDDIRASNSGGSLVLDFPEFQHLDQANSPARWVSTRSHRSWKERPTIPTPLALVLLKRHSKGGNIQP